MKTVDFTQHLLSIQTELFRFAFKLTADREEANDLLQETSLKALDNEEKFTPDTNFKGWMYTIMRNIFMVLRNKLTPLQIVITNGYTCSIFQVAKIAKKGVWLCSLFCLIPIYLPSYF